MLERNVFDVRFAISAGVGVAIAMGIFRMPHEVAMNVSDLKMFYVVWVTAALFCFASACPIAEIAATYPCSGGPYVYVRKAFGALPGFVIGYMDWINISAAAALIAAFLSEQLNHVTRTTTESFPALPILLVTLLACVHLRSSKASNRFHVAVTIIKLSALLFILLGIGLFPARHFVQIHASASSPALRNENLFFAFQAVTATFGGWLLPIYFGAEMRTPSRTMPRALFGTIGVIALIYFALLAVLTARLPMEAMRATNSPFDTAAFRAFGSFGSTLLSTLIFLIGLSALSACLMGAPRVLYSLAQDGFFSELGKTTSGKGVPRTAIVLTTVLTIGLLLTRTFRQTLGMLALIDAAAYALLLLSAMVIRQKNPNIAPSYRAWGHPFTTGFAFACAAAFVLSGFFIDFANSMLALLLAGSGAVAFLVLRKSRRH